MPKVKLDVGAEIDFLNKKEMDDALDGQMKKWRQLDRELLSGIKYMRIPRMVGQASGETLILGDTAPAVVGPESGYAWSVRRISIQGLTNGTTPDVVGVYRNDYSTVPVWQLNGNTPFQTFGKMEFILLGDETLVFYGTSVMATGYIIAAADVVQVPEQMLGKLAF